MSKRETRRLPHDFHLWTAVASTVDPLRRKGLLKFASAPLPLPAEEPPPVDAVLALLVGDVVRSGGVVVESRHVCGSLRWCGRHGVGASARATIVDRRVAVTPHVA